MPDGRLRRRKIQGTRQTDQVTGSTPGQLCRGLQQCRVFLGSGAQAPSAHSGSAEDADRRGLWPRRGQGQDRQASRRLRQADEFAWPAPFTLEMQSCGFPNARWDLSTHKLTVCYELAAEFADLYRSYGGAAADGVRTADSSK